MKNIIIVIVAILCFTSCQNKNKISLAKKYKYEVRPTEDNSWTSSGLYYCDSIKFISANEAILYTDGRQQKIYSKLIRVYQRY